MPKSKEIVSSSGSGSESDDEPKTKKMKAEAKAKSKPSTSNTKVSKGSSKTGGRSTNDDGEVKFEIGKMRFATVCDFRGKKMVNIREFYQNDDGDLKPGKKGIALSIEQWKKLKEFADEIDDALDAL